MGMIAMIILAVSRQVCTFLLETGSVFEGFFKRISNLLLPVFAFWTFYSLIVIGFACVYRIIDRFLPGVHFSHPDPSQDISFTESLYFSVVTLSTVGYGDVAPVSVFVRVIVGIQIVCGVLLVLFGFYELIRYTRDRENQQWGD